MRHVLLKMKKSVRFNDSENEMWVDKTNMLQIN